MTFLSMNGREMGFRISRAVGWNVQGEKESAGFLVPLTLYMYMLGPHFPDWLLLQVSSRVVIEGKPLALRCLGWKNKKVSNILFYHNNKTFRFSSWNSEFTIPKTNLSHSGIYHCEGNKHFKSAGVSITVKGIVSE